MKNRMTLFCICITLLLPAAPAVRAEELPPENSAMPAAETAAPEEPVSAVLSAAESAAESAPAEALDLQETLAHAAARLNGSGRQRLPALPRRQAAAGYPLSSQGRVARIPALSGGEAEYISMFFIGGRPAYCIEPEVAVFLSGGQGPSYTPERWSSLRPEDTETLKRIAWFGYGHPLTGASPAAYVATQMLIWEIVSPYYETINQNLEFCAEPSLGEPVCTAGRQNVDELMASIRDLTRRYDTVPSFADCWHGVREYEIGWDETLCLEDENQVLDWFCPDSREPHEGIQIRREGNRLLVDIDSLYYDGPGKPLTFVRDPQQWTNMLNGVLLYSSGSSQRLLGEDSQNPTPQYQLAFRLKTGGIEITKLDEYGIAGNHTEGTEYAVGWYEDPQLQYEDRAGGGLGDPYWTDRHDAGRRRKDDRDGLANEENGMRFYYPVLEKDGSRLRTWRIGADGRLKISGFLPAERTWWLREVKASNPYVLDSRVFSVRTGAAGTCTARSFVNGLRDVTLEIIKQDEEEKPRKISGAGYRIYEIGEDLDWSRTPVPYGAETDLDRPRKPLLSYAQLKRNTTLQPQDRFESGGWTFTIESEQEQGWTVRAERTVSGPPEEQRVFSRYQLPAGLRKGAALQMQDVRRMHASRDPAAWDSVQHHAEIRAVDAAENTVTLCETDLQENIRIFADSTPTLEQFQAAAAQQNTVLKPGARTAVEGRWYTVKTLNEDGLIAAPDRIHVVDLQEGRPVYADLPDPLDLEAGDVFTLEYPAHRHPHGRLQASFQVLASTPSFVRLGMNPQADGFAEQYEIARPEWISYEDIPGRVERPQQLRIAAISLPSYEVTDSRGVRYRVSAAKTEVLRESGEDGPGSSRDITYAELRGAETAGGPGGACREPYDPQGCPAGTARVKQLPKTEFFPYEGVQYEDLSPQERGLEAGETLLHDGVLYTVVQPDDGASVGLSYVQDGLECRVELAAGRAADAGRHTAMETVTFTVTDRRLREFDLDWESLQVPKNSLCRQRRFHLRPFSEEETQGDLSWAALPQPAPAAGGRFTDANGVEYTVLYQDAVNRRMVLQSARGRYEVTPQTVKNVLPLDYAGLLRQERENGRELMPGDALAGVIPERLEAGESFPAGGFSCSLLARELEADRESRTLEDPQNGYRRTLACPWPADAPLTYAEILEKGDGTGAIPVDSARYAWQAAAGGNILGTLTESPGREDGRKWTYYRLETYDRQSHAPYERQEPVFRIEVPRPEELVWADLEAVQSAPKAAGDWFRAAGKRWRIVDLAADAMRIRAEKSTADMVLRRGATPEEKEPAGVTYEAAAAARRDLAPGGRFSLAGRDYQVLGKKDTARHGQCWRIRRLNPKKDFDVLELPEADAYEPELVDFYHPDQSYDLQERYPQAAGFRLRNENPHIRLDTENRPDGMHTCMRGDGPASAELQLLNAAGLAVDCRRIVISGQREGRITGLPVFSGESGSQYVRLTDPQNHNRPLPFQKVSFCRDEQLHSPVRTAVSSATGEISVSDLKPGRYWYRDPLDAGTVHSFAVAEPADAEGMLRVSGLKWGRSYMACEFDLPEGYDHGRNEVCTILPAAAGPGENRVTAQLENRLRRLRLQVLKVDQDDRSTPLNGAWFTVRDIEDGGVREQERLQSEDAARIRLADIPADAEAGDLVPVLRAEKKGPLLRYRIEQVEKEQIVIEQLTGNRPGGRYYVPRKGYSRTSPVLYSDILRAAGKLKTGAVFEVRRKQDIALLKTYRILALEKAPGLDLFGRPGGPKVIVSAVLADPEDASHRILRLQNALDSGSRPQELLGHFVSGAILTQMTEMTAAAPLLPDGLKPETLKTADQFMADVRTVVRMPSYADVQALKPEPGSRFPFAGQTWELTEQTADRMVLKLQNREVILHPYTHPGALAVMQKHKMTVKEITGGHMVLCTDEEGDSYCLQTPAAKAETGQPGVYVAAAKDENMKEIVADGYTDASGQLLFDRLPEGRYWVERGGVREETVVENGVIHLPAVKYGHAVEVCEIRSPLGYIIGNACEVVHPKAEYSVDTVRNRRANKAVRRIRRIIRIRRMGAGS